MDKELSQEEKELMVLKQVLNVLQSIELESLRYLGDFEKLVYAKGLLQGFINIKQSTKKINEPSISDPKRKRA